MATQDATTFTAEVKPLPLFDSQAKWPTGTKISDGNWIVPITKVTETTVTFYFALQCGDFESCPTPDEKMTLPFESRNTPTVVVLGSNLLSATGTLTAPAWAFAKMYNTGKETLDLKTMDFGPSYKIPASVPSKVYLPYFPSQEDGGDAEITVKNGVITALN